LKWNLTPRSDVVVGVQGSRTAEKDRKGSTDGRGLTLSYDYQWTQLWTASVSLVGEHDDINAVPPGAPASTNPTKQTANGFGATFDMAYKGQLNQLQLTVGQTFTPSGAGGTYRSDQFQAEFKRTLTPRTSFVGAARYIHNVAVSSIYASGNYDYVIGTADLKWMASPTLYFAGGFQYLETRSFGTTPNNKMLHVLFGYEALGRRY
jgi:hypothetical protein